MLCKDLVSCVKKTSLTNEAAFFNVAKLVSDIDM